MQFCKNPSCSAIAKFGQARPLLSMAGIAYGLCDFCINPLGKIDNEAMTALLMGTPFSLVCLECDADASEPHEALLAGWKNITADDGPGWNFLGYCPECAKENAFFDHEVAKELEALNADQQCKNQQMELF